MPPYQVRVTMILLATNDYFRHIKPFLVNIDENFLRSEVIPISCYFKKQQWLPRTFQN